MSMLQEVSDESSAMEKKGIRRYLTRNLVCFTALITIILTALGHIPPNPWGGFYCDDTSIQAQRRTDTMSTKVLFALLCLPPIVVFYVSERMPRAKAEVPSNVRSRSGSPTSGGGAAKKPVEGAFARAKSLYLYYLAGLLFTTCFNEVTKVLVAEPRPHFFETCQPDFSTGVCAVQTKFVYYSDVSCRGDNVAAYGVPKTVTDSMKSFPSGHAQLSAYAATFFAIYLLSHPSLKTPSGLAWKFLGIVFFVCFAISASVTRVLDRRHHWWDVLAGDVFGIATALIMKMCSERDEKTEAKSER